MVDSRYKNNARHLKADLAWFQNIVNARYQLHHFPKKQATKIKDISAPVFTGKNSPYQQCIEKLKLSWEERLVLVLSLTPYIHPNLLDDFFKNQTNTSQHTTSEFSPTLETALFLLGGDDLEARFINQQLFDIDANLIQNKLITIEQNKQSPTRNHSRLLVTDDYLSLFTSGRPYHAEYSHNFPAKRINTHYEWDDLVLPTKTAIQVDEIRSWMKHGDTLLYQWGLIKRFSPGYKCLFYGPPGTGKTMTAALLGKASGLDLYRIDLSLVVSKYIGETEKNLRKIFDAADNKQWILFFDEADALFSKRTDVQDAHDRFANQETAYLLQRIEDHNGVVILASNLKNNLDEAFQRRLQNIVHFPIPNSDERLRIWQCSFSKHSTLEPAIDLKQIAEKYELAGGAIMNVVRYASLMAIEAGGKRIHLQDILRGIQREYTKDGRSIPT